MLKITIKSIGRIRKTRFNAEKVEFQFQYLFSKDEMTSMLTNLPVAIFKDTRNWNEWMSILTSGAGSRFETEYLANERSELPNEWLFKAQ